MWSIAANTVPTMDGCCVSNQRQARPLSLWSTPSTPMLSRLQRIKKALMRYQCSSTMDCLTFSTRRCPQTLSRGFQWISRNTRASTPSGNWSHEGRDLESMRSASMKMNIMSDLLAGALECARSMRTLSSIGGISSWLGLTHLRSSCGHSILSVRQIHCCSETLNKLSNNNHQTELSSDAQKEAKKLIDQKLNGIKRSFLTSSRRYYSTWSLTLANSWGKTNQSSIHCSSK